MREIEALRPTDATPWLLCGDFNITMDPTKRNKPNVDWRVSLRFSQLILRFGLLNLALQECRYIWSNDRFDPSMAKLDRFLISDAWNTKYLNSLQMTLPNTASDHCPILYTASTKFYRYDQFRFENF